jgi:predicted  nucleic acid-binding Zn-ribbon protein
MSNAKHPQSPLPQDEAPAYSVPKISLIFPPAFHDALAELTEAREKCAKARGGFHSIDRQIGAIEAKATTLRTRIEQAGGAAAAARAMGLASASEETASSLAKARDELAAAMAEIGELESAKAHGPRLIEPLIEDLEAKIAAARGQYAEMERDLRSWADVAIAAAKEITAEAEYLKRAIGLTAPAMQPPALCAFEREQLAELFAARETIRATQDEARPLVVASPAESPKSENVFELEKRQQEQWARDREKNRLAQIEGDKRRADEERAHERAELKRRNAAREDLAPPPIAVSGGRSAG